MSTDSTSLAADGAVSLPLVSPIFGDHMVLQRGKPNTLWGWAKAGDAIRVEIAEHSATATAGADGRWEAKIDPPPAGGPYTIRISGPKTIEIQDVLVGDVWLCGGQSNMQFALREAKDGAAEVKAADVPQVRFFIVGQHASYAPTATPQGNWKVCSPQTAGQGLSAVAYFFASKLNSELKVPIGLVQDCIGGTSAETWTSPEGLKKLGGYEKQLAETDRLRQLGGPEYGNYIMPWYDQYDIGLKGKTWAAADFDDSGWKTVQIPGGFAELGVPDAPAVCWFRKEITLSDPLPAGGASIHLGSIEQMDTTYINGQWVGASAWVENPRVYAIHSGILKPGSNVVAVRDFKVKPHGGFISPGGDLKLVLGNGTSIPLAGEWKGAVSVDAKPPHPMPLSFENWPTMPSVLYQGMIVPIAPLALTGAIWYQGEANWDRGYQYRNLLPQMIADWRSVFGQGDFPFYIVSLPAYQQRKTEPGEDGWAEVRESQAIAAHDVPNSGLAVTIDTGEADNIHPKDKRPVGERLALCALALHYGQKIPCSGPTYTSAEQIPGALKLHFDHIDGGLVVKGDKLGEFSVAGADHQWHWADAKIDGDSVIVSSPQVPTPVAARYAWQSNPVATLFNGAGLPATPFRTDDWPLSSQNHH